MNNELNDKYLEKIKKLKKQEIKIDEENEEHCFDNEAYHVYFDSILVDLLKELGYEEIVREYENAEHHFWYA